MNIIGNIPGGIKLLSSLKGTGKYRKKIESARAKGDDHQEQCLIRDIMHIWGAKICRSLGIDVEVEGEENLPQEGPVVYVANHQSYTDIFVACKVLSTVQFGFVAKRDLLNLPFYGKWLKRIRSIDLDRGDAKRTLQQFNEAGKLLNRGFSLLIFPEGTRSKGDFMAEFHQGSLALATRPKVPVIPVTFDGNYRSFEETGVFRPNRVKVTIHEKIETKDMDRKESRALASRVEDIVRSALPGEGRVGISEDSTPAEKEA